MKIAYFDCPTGISGNMILGALIDAGLSPISLKKELKKLKLKGWGLVISNITKNGFTAKHLDVDIKDTKRKRTIHEIYAIINKSTLKKTVKDLSIRIFERLFNAESKVHGGKISHLHETGAIDAIIDIVGAAIGLDKLGIKEVYCSPLPYGYGSIKCEHGILPNPAPATLELLKGIPIYKKNIKGELVTPTGAAIISTIAKSFTDMPKLRLDRTGHGAGTFKFNEPNILRLFIGEAETSYNEDLIVSIETNIDNMNPELYDHVIKQLMANGALDAYITPIQMKKNRPGIKLTALCGIKDKERLTGAIFSETSTLGVRTCLVKREKLERQIKQVRTRYGIIKVKIGMLGRKIMNISPEYDDAVRLAKRTGIPLKALYDEARSQAMKQKRG